MTEATSAARIRNFLPKDWWRAPTLWMKQDLESFLIFVGVNFFFGTLGIWLPLVNALLGGHKSLCDAFHSLLVSGGFYMYAVPFLATTVGVVFTSLKQEATELSPGTKVLFSFASTLIFLTCAILLQIQVLGPAQAREDINFALQLFVSLATIAVALYMHALIQNERGSPQSDMQDGAVTLSRRAQTASVSPGDFS